MEYIKKGPQVLIFRDKEMLSILRSMIARGEGQQPTYSSFPLSCTRLANSRLVSKSAFFSFIIFFLTGDK